MKPFDYYSKPNSIPPYKCNYTTYFVYKNGEVLAKEQHTDLKNIKQKYPNCTIEEVFDKESFNQHWKEYDKERFALEKEFKEDLFKEFKVEGNPKSEKCYELAWGYGHCSGFSEVYDYFYDLVELIK